MKSLSWAVLGLLMAAPSFAADNNIKMVTYFPVPYAAYGDLGVTGTCDVGLMGQCKLDAGKSLTVAKASSDSRALNTGSIIVRKGTLGLNPASSLATGTSITAGSGIGTGVLEFSHDLAVTSISSSRLAKARAMNEAQLDSLNMYGHGFPACDAKNHEISWKNLTIGNKSGVFLVCGAGVEVEETSEQNPNQEKCCTGSNVFWDGSQCMRRCVSTGEYKREFNNWDSSRGGFSGRWTSGVDYCYGTCPNLQRVASESGASKQCEGRGTWYSRETVYSDTYLTCEYEDLGDDFSGSYECWFANPYKDPDADCVAGVMRCTREKSEWTCPATQTCGTTKNSCL